ncbi:Protein FAR1-RELATED SEQUENCE [Arachis hypogaea]|nr:Protein FAR1-RELATED SEQUENCE [Arachis hypogaea]
MNLTFCGVDYQFVPKVGMTFNTLEDAAKFYKDYSKVADQAQMLKQHRELSMSVRRTIENNEEASIRPSKTYQSFVAAAGSHRELNFIEKDVRNYITREVRNVSEQENAKEFGKYLLRMKDKNQNFLFELELEDDQSIKLAFWADARNRAACEYFGDVISFDTTYNTNRYNMVCGSFVGVNYHGQSTLLECTLMKNEDIQSFKWLFQCGFIAWEERLRKGFSRINVHRCKGLSRLYGLVDNKWLSELYEGRHIWIPIYLDHHFCAGMRSIQRNESMHSFFKKFITRNSSLIQFVKQYDNCLGSREQKEREFDAADFHTVIPCAKKSSIEAQFQHIKKVKRRHTHIKSSHDEPLLEPRIKRFDELVFHLQNICEFTSESEELTAILHRAYDNVMVEMEELKAKRKGTCSLSHEDANLESVNELQSLPRVRIRGRPKNRLGSKLDKQIANASKKKKTKALSELNLFDAASVVQPNSSKYHGHVMNYQFRDPAAGDRCCILC